ncbi:gamma-glutamylcyclotransferase [Zavarzinia sp. CC-PAN008]|uniref:gamma-glutamylcyclotransferase n=1 Tax=Zavarzinia sp. CC-PAN008 TaxID=3243332 RepID=UPI003F744E3F
MTADQPGPVLLGPHELPRPFRVFAYGSLMWRPGFPVISAEPGLLRGWHRTFCIRSTDYRGTHDCPGLVLGLDAGGSCRGRVLTVAEADVGATLAYLRDRELTPPIVYREAVRMIETASGRLAALCYVVDRRRPNYAGNLSLEQQAAMLAVACGTMGTNREYLYNTLAHLDEMGLRETELHRLARLVPRSP